jgi:hypothetical protein
MKPSEQPRYPPAVANEGLKSEGVNGNAFIGFLVVYALACAAWVCWVCWVYSYKWGRSIATVAVLANVVDPQDESDKFVEVESLFAEGSEPPRQEDRNGDGNGYRDGDGTDTAAATGGMHARQCARCIPVPHC